MNNYPVSKVTHYCNISVSKCMEIRPEKINFYDLTFVLSGSMTYTSNGKICVLSKNDAIFLKPGTVRSRHAGNEPVRYASFNFHLNPGFEMNFDDYLPNCISGDIRKLVAVFPQSHLSKHYHSVQKVTNMLNYILFELTDTVSLDCTNEHVLKIIHYVQQHINEKLTLADISRKVSLSKEYTSYIFKKEMNKPLTEYINERKMLLAKDMIQGGEMPLADIAVQLGFENYNYFSRLFRRYFDIAPVYLKNRK